MNLYVGKLSRSMTEDSIRKLFEQFGQVTSVKLIIDKITGNPRGFAFVEMPLAAEAQQAIEQLDGQLVEGQNIVVNQARTPEQRSSFGPRSGGSRFGGNGGGPRRPRTGGGFNNNSWGR